MAGFTVWGELQRQLDFAAVARASPEPETSQESARGPVLPQRRGGEEGQAVRAGPIHRAPRELSADAQALQIVGDLGGYLRNACSIGDVRVSGHADDRSVAFVDRDDRLIADVIDFGEARKLPRRQLALRSEVSQAA
jgi:hypothetical protein